MNPTDPRLQAALDAALGHVSSTAASAATRTAELLGGMASGATRVFERDAFLAAQFDLRHRLATFSRAFDEHLRERVSREVAPRPDARRSLGGVSWESLSLVDDAEVEEQMFSDRISQTISHECEVELRELATYMGALLRIGSADQDRNPFRPEAIGAATFRAIEAVSPERDSRKLLARELGPVMAKAMRICYDEISSDLKSRGVQPVHLSVRGVEGPGNDRVTSGYASLSRDAPAASGSSGSHFDASAGAPLDAGRRSGASRGGRLDGSGPGSLRGGASRFGSTGRGSAAGAADAELMSLIRRLTFVPSRPGAFDAADTGSGVPSSDDRFVPPSGRSGVASGRGGGSGATPLSGTSPGLSAPGALGGGTGGLRGDGLTGMMAVNLIRAHREELRQASTGTLDHMVIDVVGSLFDQILSDSRVPPQMARQIARLQLPVLRVALADPSFFSSRKHPVRRFVNRIASLACAFDDFDDGPGRLFLARVRELVQEIIEGDFDQVEVYAAKLTLLEAFIAQQTEGDLQARGNAAELLDGKESELRVQQRYMQQLQSALAPLAMHDYLRDFLTQVWSQALALAVRRDGPSAERTQRLRQAATALVMSVQPKGTPAHRKAFLMQLPGLMKTLHEGMALIGWPQEAQKSFFGQLLPAHAESLKGQALSDLDRNLLARQLESAFAAPLPRAEALVRGERATPLDAPEVAPHFSPDERERTGLVDEGAVDWNGKVDIDLGAEAEPADGDLQIAGLPKPEPAEPATGKSLADHVQIGFAYQMHLEDKWQKVRLNHVSPGRTFFVFTRGGRHKQTISMTHRMLVRLCETGRLRAFENGYLIERATARARRQLAALGYGATA